MAFWLFSAAVAFLFIATVLPLFKSPVWWVRAFEFPRFQLAVFALGLLVGEVVCLKFEDTSRAVLLAITAGCFVYQALWILPYTTLVRPEVKPAVRSDRDPRLRLLASNVLMPNRHADALLALVEREKPDVVITVETNRWWEEKLAPLRERYPHVLCCPLENLYGMHLFSRFPLIDPKVQWLVEKDKPSMHASIALPSGERVELHCLHPAPPSPTENETAEQRDAELVLVGRAVAKSRAPIVVAGDLNDVAWSATTRLFRKLSGLLDPRVGRGMYSTFHTRYPCFRWPLDHFFHSRHFTLVELRRLPSIGSDHFPMLIELALRDPAAKEQRDHGLDPEPEDRAEAQEKVAAAGAEGKHVHRPGKEG